MPVLDEYLEFVAGRCRPNTVLAVGYDLQAFFRAVGKPPEQVMPADVLGFMTAQRTGGPLAAVQPARESGGGVSTATLRRRLSSVSGLFGYLQATGVVAANPVPRGLPSRREKVRPSQPVPLVRGTRRLPRLLTPVEVDTLTAALRTHRDRAMVAAMVLGGLRRCEVLGLHLSDLRAAERRVFIADGKGGHQRLVPVSGRFFTEVAAYLDLERPPRPGTDAVFVALKGPTRGRGGRDPGRRPPPRRAGACDLPRAAPHLPDPAAGGRHGVGGGAGPGRARLDRVHPHLPAPGRQLAG